MNDLLDMDLPDAVVANTCERLANLIGLACPTNPAQLQLLALLETGIQHARTEAVPEAARTRLHRRRDRPAPRP